MKEQAPELRSIMRRPIDCSPKLLNKFAEVVLANGEVPLANLRRGIPSAEMLFFTLLENKVVAVSCVRFQNAEFHKHLFERAGVPKMYNPHSVEVCWLSVLPEYQGIGAWSAIYGIRRNYMKDRPGHAITRVENERVADLSRYGYEQVGEPFYPATGKDLIRLIVTNHDTIFDPAKKLRYC